jgi:hypothetical protein
MEHLILIVNSRRHISKSNKTAPEKAKNRETVHLIVLRNRSEFFFSFGTNLDFPRITDTFRWMS